MGEIQIREVLPGEYEDTGSLTRRAYAEYARPGDPLWDTYFGMLADVARRAASATVLVAVADGRIVGTATVELDRTIEGTGGSSPARPTCGCSPWTRRLGGAAWAGGWSRHACRSPAGPGRRPPPCTPPSRWWPHSVSTGPWASGAIRRATLSCTLIWSCEPSGCRSGHWKIVACHARHRELTGAGRHGRCQAE
jgi:hypothetical protein